VSVAKLLYIGLTKEDWEVQINAGLYQLCRAALSSSQRSRAASNCRYAENASRVFLKC
jgi:hypothetical protein